MKRERAALVDTRTAAKFPLKEISIKLNAFDANELMLKSFPQLFIINDGVVEGVVTRENVVSSLVSFLRHMSSLLVSGKQVSVYEKRP